MHTLLKIFQAQRCIRLVQLCVLALLASTMQAAPMASFSAAASGTTSSLTLSVTANVADADVGTLGKYYLGFKHNNAWFFHNGWDPLESTCRHASLSIL